MSITPFSFTHAEDGTESLVLLDQTLGVRIVPETHLNFPAIKTMLLSGDSSAAEVYALADAAAKVASKLNRLSERVTIKGDTIYFDGDQMESRLTTHIVNMVKGGDDNYSGYVKFLENVQANPSKSGRKGLFKFLDKHDLVITEDGCFIGYKGVGRDGKSITAGKEDVTVTLADGTVEVHQGHIPYPVGAVIEMARSLVDPDRDTACSVGLHIGNHSYANSFSRGGFLTVAVNPRDVVVVPSDSNDQKIRAHRMTVLELNADRTQYTGTSLVLAVDDDDEDDTYSDWDDEDDRY